MQRSATVTSRSSMGWLTALTWGGEVTATLSSSTRPALRSWPPPTPPTQSGSYASRPSAAHAHRGVDQPAPVDTGDDSVNNPARHLRSVDRFRRPRNALI